MDYKLVDERIQSMMKTVNAIKEGLGMEYVSTETYIAFFDAFSNQLSSESNDNATGDSLDKSEYYLNKAIKELESLKEDDFVGDEFEIVIYKEIVARRIILEQAKTSILKLHHDAISIV